MIEGFVILCLKCNAYQDDLLYILAINSSQNRFSSWLTAKYESLVLVLS